MTHEAELLYGIAFQLWIYAVAQLRQIDPLNDYLHKCGIPPRGEIIVEEYQPDEIPPVFFDAAEGLVEIYERAYGERLTKLCYDYERNFGRRISMEFFGRDFAILACIPTERVIRGPITGIALPLSPRVTMTLEFDGNKLSWDINQRIPLHVNPRDPRDRPKLKMPNEMLKRFLNSTPDEQQEILDLLERQHGVVYQRELDMELNPAGLMAMGEGMHDHADMELNPAGLTAKGERMYGHIKHGYGDDPRAAEIAARTVMARAHDVPGLVKNPPRLREGEQEFRAEVGQTVDFGRPKGQRTKGKVVGVADKTVLIESLETRGAVKSRPAGRRYRVPRTTFFLKEAGGMRAAPAPAPPADESPRRAPGSLRKRPQR